MTTTLAVEARPVPLTLDATGRWRVTGSRIALERLVECYRAGMDAKEIVAEYDTLRLADVHAVISYYLDHQTEVEQYIRHWQARAQEVEAKIKTAQPMRPGLKEELLARWAEREKGNATAGQ